MIGEIAVLPLVFGLAWYGLIFSILNAALLGVRVRAESAALAAATGRRARAPARP